MEIMNPSLITLVVYFTVGLIILNILSYYSRRTNLLPHVIWTLGIGMLYGALSHFSALNIVMFTIDPHVIFFTLIPILIFASSKNMCLHHFRKVLRESTILATLGIIISALIVALILFYLLDVPFLTSLLFGVIISATDPIAVGAILHESKNISAEKKMLIEGESILNDGFVVAIFATLSLLVLESKEINLYLSGWSLVLNIFLALGLGALLGRIARAILRIWRNESPELTMNITIALAFSSFILAEFFHIPGILAIFAAALAFGYKPDESLEKTQVTQRNIWEYLEYLANQILFFFLGASFFAQTSLELITLSTIVISVLILFFSRFLAIFILKPLLRIEGNKVNTKDFWLLNLSGSRGAVSIALILLLPDDFTYKPLFLTLAFLIVIVSLVFYPIILKRSLKIS